MTEEENCFIKNFTPHFIRGGLLLLAIACLSTIASAQTRTLRIVTYNIGADFTGETIPFPGLIAPVGDSNNVTAGGVLEGIGEELLNSNAQPLDILALQETTSNTVTVQPIVDGLNTFYNTPGMYATSPFQATSSSPTSGGNGPNALVYNTKTLRLLASIGLAPPSGTSYGSSSGMYRQVMRYQFAPAGVATNTFNVFYIYVSHYKSSSSGILATNQLYRNGEAQIIRNNSATLPGTARILYVGDFNTGDSSEPMYSTLINPGVNQALDPVNPAGATNLTWDGNSVLNVKTYSPNALHYRDDYQMMTTNVYYGTPGGLTLVAGTYHVFGNNGSVTYLGKVNSGGNTALNNKLVTNGPVFINAAQLFLDLTSASDHLPVVADYTIPIPAPVITGISLAGMDLTLTVTNGITNAVYTALMTTNLALPLTNWATVATNVATGGNFTFIATNVVELETEKKFFLLQTK